MALNKTDKSFKTLINKRFTTPDRKFYQEIGKDTLNTHMREVWMNTIPEDSASAIIQGYAAYYEQWILTSDPTYADQAFYFISGSGFTPGTDSINSGWLVNEASQSFFIGDFISDKYGSSYEVKLYDASGSQLFKTDAINWIFDYKTGVLHIADPGAYPTPYKVTVFKYTGLTLADPGAIPSGSISGSVSNWTGSVDGSISRYSDVKITGSLDVSNTITAFSGTIGSTFGDVAIFNISPSYIMRVGAVTDKLVGDFLQNTSLFYSPTTITNATLRAFRYNINGDVTNYTQPVFIIRNQDDTTTSDNLIIQSGDSSVRTRLNVDYWGNMFVSGNITLSDGKTVDGVDIDIFSSSVATQIANLETGSGQWTVELDGSISRNSDVRITGSLYISGSDNRLYGTASWAETSSQAVSSFYAVTSSYAESVAPGIGGLWTGSNGHISRFGTVKVSGSMYYRQGDRIYFGDGDTYIHESSDDQISMVFPAGTAYFDAYQISFTGFNSPGFGNVTATATVPNIVPRIGDIDTGLGHAADNILSLIAGSTNILNVVYASNTGSVGIGTTAPISNGPYSLHVWGNVSASNLYWEGTNLTSFSSSVATNLTTLNTITGSYWTGSAGGAISRSSDVQITGDLDINGGLNIDQVQWGNAISIDADRYINFNGGSNYGWIMTQISSPSDTLILGYSKMGSNIGYFVFSRGTGDKTNVIIYSGSLVVNKDQDTYNPSNVFEVYGDSFMSGSIEVPPNATVDGVDISEFSSSVAQQIVNIETGSSIWSLEGDNSISRNSDVKITGSLYFTGSKWEDRIVLPDSQFIKFSDNWKIASIDLSDELYFEFDKTGTNVGTFGLQPGVKDLILFNLYSGSVEINTQGSPTATTNGIVLTAYGQSLLYGDVDVRSNILMQGGKTVDGVDISEFSSSVAQQIVNIETGSSIWSLENDGSISRDSDVIITGSVHTTGSAYYYRAVDDYVKVGDLTSITAFPDGALGIYNRLETYGLALYIYEATVGSAKRVLLETDATRFNIYSGGGDLVIYSATDITFEANNINLDGDGNLFVTGNISLPTGSTVDGVDISEFSSSVATNLTTLNTITGSYWTGSAGGSINRASDVQITGDLDINGGLNIDQTQWGNAISIDTDRYINFIGGSSSGWRMAQLSTPSDTFIAEYTKIGNNIGYFVFYHGTDDKTNVIIFSGSLVVNKDQDSYNPSNVFEVYGDSYMDGNIDVPALATVDGVDISEFSSSVAQQIYNLETGSTPWTTEVDDSISRNSDVRITGSLDINGNITGDITRTNLSYKSTMSADYSAIIGGAFNEMVGFSNNYNVILGGRYNNFVNNNTDFAGILAGELNTIAADWSVILGGYDNTMNGEMSAILGGQENKIDWDAIQGVILGGVGLINSGSSQVVLGEWNKKGNTSDIFVIGNGTTDLNRSDSFTITSGGDLTLSGSITLSPSETVDGVDISSFSSSVEQRITNAETGSALWSLEQDGSITRNSNVRITGSTYIESGVATGLEIVRDSGFNNKFEFIVGVGAVELDLYDGNGNYLGLLAQNNIHSLYSQNLLQLYSDQFLRIGDNQSHTTQITGSVNITGSTTISGNLDVDGSGSFSYLSVDGGSIIAELITANTGSFDLLDVANSASFQDYVEVNGFIHIDGGTW